MTFVDRRKPAILLLGTQMAVGGAQQLLFDQADEFHRLGYPVTAAFLYDRDGLYAAWQAAKPYPVLDLRAFAKGKTTLRGLFRFFAGLARLLRLLSQGRFGAIETFTHHSNLIGCGLAWLSGVPVRVASHHGSIDRMPKLWIRLHAWMVNLGMANCLVAVSKDVYAQSIQEGVKPARLVLIPNGVKPSQVDEQAVQSLRARLVSSPQGFLIISAGRLTYQKGHTFLLQAMPEILKQFPNTCLAIAGGGPLRDELEAEAQALGIAEKVRFLGILPEVRGLMAAADLFVLPSRWEGLPLVLLEAMSSRCAIVATPAEGVREALGDGHCGVLVPIEDSRALAEAVCSLLGDPERRRYLADCAYRRFVQEYVQDKMVISYLRLLDPNMDALEAVHAVDQR